METSYFAKYRGGIGVSIALVTPSWFFPTKTYRTYKPLFPNKHMVYSYKRNKDEKIYTKYYQKILDKLSPEVVYEDLRDYVLLCYEKPGDFCHRRLVANLLEQELGVTIPEIKY